MNEVWNATPLRKKSSQPNVNIVDITMTQWYNITVATKEVNKCLVNLKRKF